MGLSKYRIGELISVVDERNNLGLRNFYGININKEFMPTVADTEGLDEAKYKVVRKNRFVFSGMQTGRDQCIRISMYNQESPIIVSPAYTTFEIADSAKDLVIPMYFFMLFLSKEKDRLGAFYSDGSIRSNLDWERFCDIEILLPSKDIQHKYVDIYNAALKNQQCYERGLDDLKLACDSTVENFKKVYAAESFGKYIKRVDLRNTGNKHRNVKNVSVTKEFSDVSAKVNKEELSNYKVVLPRQISFVQTTHNEHVFCNAMNNTNDAILVTSVNEVFECDESHILPEYLCATFNREEFDRYARFHSWGSARETFTWTDLLDVKIPIPPIETQKSIADLFTVLRDRTITNSILKKRIKSLCPILIKGSILEARNQS